jgi:hypothetical protein
VLEVDNGRQHGSQPYEAGCVMVSDVSVTVSPALTDVLDTVTS